MSKKPFLLFELLIALSLMGILLSFLFSFMVQGVKLEKKMDTARASILERQNLHTRLSDLFTSLCPYNNELPLYTLSFPKEEKESLIVIFDHGIDIDPTFGGPLLGRLYIDEEKNFCLASWPASYNNERPWHKETLMSNVSDFSLSFLSTSAPRSPAWSSSWPKEKNQLPSIIRLTVKQENLSLLFAFQLPSAHPIIPYEKQR